MLIIFILNVFVEDRYSIKGERLLSSNLIPHLIQYEAQMCLLFQVLINSILCRAKKIEI